ncbi:MAG TPA: hypothetical protein VKR21_04350 [Solirubrobacteraceae bacterium]|nr:hypothetical protein [Solirubrobacteraceae bacterium]
MQGHLPHPAPILAQLRERISLASYEVDPVAVADAIVRRRWRVDVVSPPAPKPRGHARVRTRARVSCIAGRGSAVGSRALAA